jgi:hypothetical protein
MDSFGSSLSPGVTSEDAALRHAINASNNEVKDGQDHEFHESLFADAEKAREKRRLEEEEREQAALNDVLAESMSSAKEEENARKGARRHSAESRLGVEPEKGTSNCVSICFRLPGLGKRVERRFLESDSLVSIFDFLASREELCGVSWEVHQAQPAKSFSSIEEPQHVTLKELGLCPRALLLVRDADA